MGTHVHVAILKTFPRMQVVIIVHFVEISAVLKSLFSSTASSFCDRKFEPAAALRGPTRIKNMAMENNNGKAIIFLSWILKSEV
mmetsp:Transcript_5518/g.7628  ORF Transcript_5518/g.7628 Transcript_5518/m.7628 type:complete len:84 (-) Transcript_5518:27-278(-)